jgi:hypothetical protein
MIKQVLVQRNQHMHWTVITGIDSNLNLYSMTSRYFFFVVCENSESLFRCNDDFYAGAIEGEQQQHAGENQ